MGLASTWLAEHKAVPRQVSYGDIRKAASLQVNAQAHGAVRMTSNYGSVQVRPQVNRVQSRSEASGLLYLPLNQGLWSFTQAQ
jgi:hypothetical protein